MEKICYLLSDVIHKTLDIQNLQIPGEYVFGTLKAFSGDVWGLGCLGKSNLGVHKVLGCLGKNRRAWLIGMKMMKSYPPLHTLVRG